MSDTVYACLLVDDPPVNATYWARLQQEAFGFVPSETGWGRNWKALAPAPLLRTQDAAGFADLVEEFGLRGKFSFVPCPGGLGRVDRAVRGYTAEELRELLVIVRERLAPRFDLTPEVLTHTLAHDAESGALFPHAESYWLTHLCCTHQMDALKNYLRQAYAILRNVGLAPHGVTIGGMRDVSGIAEGKSLADGDGRVVLAQALLAVENEFTPGVSTTFAFAGTPPVGSAGMERRVPEAFYRSAQGARVFALYPINEDVLFDVLHGPCGHEDQIADALITADLLHGRFVEDAEAGRPVVFAIHSQTLAAMNSGVGLKILREVLRRFRERYGHRIRWLTAHELCVTLGE